MKNSFLILILYITFCKSEILLNEKEINIINNYINNTPIEKTIGQIFMVGIKSDLLNYQGSLAIEKLIVEEGIGGIILNTYNYYTNDQEMLVNNMIAFHNYLQDKARKSNLGLPLFLAVDFETPKFSSIQKGLVSPIPPMVLSSTHDKKILYNSGYLNGLQLKSIGINLLLGPTLDIYNIEQGATKSLLQNRAFAGSSKGVISTANYFIRGLKDSGMHFIIKHIPGLGSVEDNPHSKVLPKYIGSTVQFENDIKPFIKFSNVADGIMTSHTIMQAFGALSNKMVTFSKSFFDKYLQNKIFTNKIFITDDLSSMGAMLAYKEKYKKNLSDMVIDAFETGHDILLFSHTSKQFGGRYSLVKSFRDIIKIKKNLLEYIKRRHKEERFKKSLKKILFLKAIMHKQLGYKIENLFSKNNKNIEYWRIRKNYDEIKENNKMYFKKLKIHNIKDFSYKAIKVGATLIHQNDSLADYLNLPENSKIGIYCNSKYNKKFKNIIKSKTIFLKEKTFFLTKRKIIHNIEKTDFDIFIIDNEDSRNILDYIRLRNKRLSNKIIVFTFTSPLIITDPSLNTFHIVALSTQHSEVFRVIDDILSENIKINDIDNYPFKIGKNGAYHSIDNIKWISKANDEIESIQKNKKNKNLKKEHNIDNNKNNSIITDKKAFLYLIYYLIFISILIIIFFFIFKDNKKSIFSISKENKLLTSILIFNIIIVTVIAYNVDYVKKDNIVNTFLTYLENKLF